MEVIISRGEGVCSQTEYERKENDKYVRVIIKRARHNLDSAATTVENSTKKESRTNSKPEIVSVQARV